MQSSSILTPAKQLLSPTCCLALRNKRIRLAEVPTLLEIYECAIRVGSGTERKKRKSFTSIQPHRADEDDESSLNVFS